MAHPLLSLSEYDGGAHRAAPFFRGPTTFLAAPVTPAPPRIICQVCTPGLKPSCPSPARARTKMRSCPPRHGSAGGERLLVIMAPPPHDLAPLLITEGLSRFPKSSGDSTKPPLVP